MQSNAVFMLGPAAQRGPASAVTFRELTEAVIRAVCSNHTKERITHKWTKWPAWRPGRTCKASGTGARTVCEPSLAHFSLQFVEIVMSDLIMVSINIRGRLWMCGGGHARIIASRDPKKGIIVTVRFSGHVGPMHRR